jgi:hypothetical protein
MKNRKLVFILMIMVVSFNNTYGQSNKDSAIAVFKKLHDRYTNIAYLSFDIAYYYSNLSNPNLLVDSLKGKAEINKVNNHLVLGNTEIITNNKYNIILFKEDTLMYLSKPQNSSVTNPVSVIDSLLKTLSKLDVALSQKKGVQVVTISFPKGSSYEKAVFSIDEKGFLRKTVYILKSNLLLSAPDQASAEARPSQDEWGVLECKFYNYQTGKFNNTVFQESRYFKKDIAGYKATDEFKQYKIFIASPGL